MSVAMGSGKKSDSDTLTLRVVTSGEVRDGSTTVENGMSISGVELSEEVGDGCGVTIGKPSEEVGDG